jgi:hypothetical protein
VTVTYSTLAVLNKLQASTVRARTPELGTKGMVAGMKQMLKWHLEAFDACPIGDGYEIEVNEFDWKDWDANEDR